MAQTDSANHIVQINEIFVIGNKKTQRSIILREVSVRKGELYGLPQLREVVNEDQQKIYNTNLFNEVDIQILETSDTQVDLLVKVDERWYFYPSPIFEIADRNFMDWLINRGGELNRFNYGLRLDQFNFRGRNERLRFIGQLGFERKFVLSYKMPYIEKTQRHGLQFNLSYNEREDMAYITDDHLPTFIRADEISRQTWAGAITYSYRPSFYNFHFTRISYFDGNISDTIAYLNPNYYSNGATQQRYFSLSYTFLSDHRNKRTYPTTGDFLEIFVEKSGLGIHDDVDILSMMVTYNKYTDLGNDFYLANGILGQTSFPRSQPYFNYLGLGYYGIFARGFELDVIEGPNYFLQKNSLRKLFFKTEKDISNVMPVKQFSKFKMAIYGKLFTDFAWVDNYPNYEISSRLTNTFLYSVGFGLDVVSMYDLVLRLEYSYNSQDDFNFALNIKADL